MYGIVHAPISDQGVPQSLLPSPTSMVVVAFTSKEMFPIAAASLWLPIGILNACSPHLGTCLQRASGAAMNSSGYHEAHRQSKGALLTIPVGWLTRLLYGIVPQRLD